MKRYRSDVHEVSLSLVWQVAAEDFPVTTDSRNAATLTIRGFVLHVHNEWMSGLFWCSL